MNQQSCYFQDFDDDTDSCNYFRDGVLIIVYYVGEANNRHRLPLGLSYQKSLYSSSEGANVGVWPVVN